MFTQHCFIRKNTPELCQRLRMLGYHQNFFDDNSGEWLAVNHGMFISVSEGFQNLPFDDIDCDDNENLFLALAALNDKYNRNQYFICHEDFQGYKKGDWVLCESEDDICATNPVFFHKADISEILNHFNKER